MNAADVQRVHPDPFDGVAAPFDLDRQRIVHSAAFRRLQHKTQVFLAIESDHFRTRLTHTLEVAQLARTLAMSLSLRTELAEAVALAHDVGHPPFGHAGEAALDACMTPHGGFEHNAHALRVVDYLEHPYPEFRGLNLTRVVRECLAKHSTCFDRPGAHPLQDGQPPPPEGQIAALADRLTYGLHDLQDGLYADLFGPADLADLELWNAAYRGPREANGGSWRGHVRPAVDQMRQILVKDVRQSYASDSAARDSGEAPRPEIRLSDPIAMQFAALESFLLDNVYRNQRLVRSDSKARRIVTHVFDAYVEEPRLMPSRFARRAAEQGAARVAADYIAGMTDRFCLREHARLFDPQMDA